MSVMTGEGKGNDGMYIVIIMIRKYELDEREWKGGITHQRIVDPKNCGVGELKKGARIVGNRMLGIKMFGVFCLVLERKWYKSDLHKIYIFSFKLGNAKWDILLNRIFLLKHRVIM